MRTSSPIDAVRRSVATQMPTRCGMFQLIGFERDMSNGRVSIETAVAIVIGG